MESRHLRRSHQPEGDDIAYSGKCRVLGFWGFRAKVSNVAVLLGCLGMAERDEVRVEVDLARYEPHGVEVRVGLFIE